MGRPFAAGAACEYAPDGKIPDGVSECSKAGILQLPEISADGSRDDEEKR